MPTVSLPHKQIPYIDARRIVITDGWKPRPFKKGADQMVYWCGNPLNESYFNEACKKFPEVVSISADGFCKMRFYKNHVQLNIFVFTEQGCNAEKLSDKQSGAKMVGWEVVHFTDY
jgi:hypothetical protein